MRVSPQARAKAPELPEQWVARAVRMISTNGKQRILYDLSLLDRRRFKADYTGCMLSAPLGNRNQLYRELKQSMLGQALTLRSQQPAGVEPTDLSFLRALHILQHEMIWAVGMAPGKLPAHLARLRAQLQFAIIEKRRGRQCPSRQSPAKTLYRQISRRS